MLNYFLKISIESDADTGLQDALIPTKKDIAKLISYVKDDMHIVQYRKEIVVWVGIFLIALMGIFPPFSRTISGVGGTYIERGIGYYFILTQPNYEVENWQIGVKLDISRLCVQWVTVAIVTGGLLYIFREKKRV